MEDTIQQHIDRLLHYMKDEAYKPLTVQELEQALGVEDSTTFKDFVKALVQMEEKGLSRSHEKQPLWSARKNESDSRKAYWACKRICVCDSRRKRDG